MSRAVCPKCEIVKLIQYHPDSPAQLLLFEAERAWAYAQDLRDQYNEDSDNSGLRSRGLGRAKRAVQWSQDLTELIKSLGPRVDAASKLEVAVYGILTKASLAFDKSDWLSSLEHLSVARHLLAALAEHSGDSRGEALANSFIDAGEAQMRFCAYQIEEQNQDMDKVAELHGSGDARKRICPEYDELVAALQSSKSKETSDATAKEAVQIEWRGRTIPIRNLELMDAIVRARAEENALQSNLTSGKGTQDPKRSKRESTKPKRLSHAERSAKKRSATAVVGETSAAATKRAAASSRSTNDPFDHAIAALTDGELLARRLVDDNVEALSKSHSTRYQAVGEDLKVAHEWIHYRLLALQIKRSANLMQEVHEKAQKREVRKKEQLERKLARQSAPATASTKKSKKSGNKEQKPAKKPQPGSLAKRPRSGPATHRRRPAKSGTKRLQALKAAGRDARARVLSEGQSRRRSARAIPALAKLLDNSEYNLIAISALSVIESDPDASSVIDAKAAWYRAELLRQLARAHGLADERGEACLLLRRAALCVRQARQALDLVDDSQVTAEMDADIPPAMTGEFFADTEGAIEADLRQTQREIFLISRGRSPFTTPGDVGTKGKGKAAGGEGNTLNTAAHSLSQTKAGQQLRTLAGKHVDFDPVDVEEASRADADYEEELEKELREIEQKERGGKLGAAKPKAKAASNAKSAALARATSEEEEEDHAGDDHFEEAAEGDGGASTSDEEFAPAAEHDDDEDDEEEQQQQGTEKKGWFGGWFGKK